jgi:hypothetical protein
MVVRFGYRKISIDDKSKKILILILINLKLGKKNAFK